MSVGGSKICNSRYIILKVASSATETVFAGNEEADAPTLLDRGRPKSKYQFKEDRSPVWLEYDLQERVHDITEKVLFFCPSIDLLCPSCYR